MGNAESQAKFRDMAAGVFAKYDTDGDGRLSLDEFRSMLPEMHDFELHPMSEEEMAHAAQMATDLAPMLTEGAPSLMVRTPSEDSVGSTSEVDDAAEGEECEGPVRQQDQEGEQSPVSDEEARLNA